MEAARDIGLCLSGGGYRAAVFQLGSLLRLNEAVGASLVQRTSGQAISLKRAIWIEPGSNSSSKAREHGRGYEPDHDFGWCWGSVHQDSERVTGAKR
jgi:hypothetical protein